MQLLFIYFLLFAQDDSSPSQKVKMLLSIFISIVLAFKITKTFLWNVSIKSVAHTYKNKLLTLQLSSLCLSNLYLLLLVIYLKCSLICWFLCLSHNGPKKWKTLKISKTTLQTLQFCCKKSKFKSVIGILVKNKLVKKNKYWLKCTNGQLTTKLTPRYL